MTALANTQELIEKVSLLNPEHQREVLEFVQRLAEEERSSESSGTRMAKFAGTLTDEDAREMLEAIEEGCGQVDWESWK